MLVSNVEQGSEAWLIERAGRPTASNFKKIITSTGKPSTSLSTYAFELAGERLLGGPGINYTNEYMQRGNELEPEARELYEFISGNKVEQVGMCYRDEEKLYSCSPDGLVSDDGGVEIKCPKLSTHVKYLHDNKCPADYVPQVQGTLFITGRDWWDFMSYYPDVKPLIVRVYPDLEFHEKLEEGLNKLLDKINKIMRKINE